MNHFTDFLPSDIVSYIVGKYCDIYGGIKIFKNKYKLAKFISKYDNSFVRSLIHIYSFINSYKLLYNYNSITIIFIYSY